jgi:hypothetical protein
MKQGLLFRFLKGFFNNFIKQIEKKFIISEQKLPIYSATIQQSIISLKNFIELKSSIINEFPMINKYQREFLQKEFSLIRCMKCPDKWFHGICGYFNGQQFKLNTSDNQKKFNNFLKNNNSDFSINGFCDSCSIDILDREDSPRNKIQLEFLRRLPVNINFINKKLNFESFCEWKKQNENYFILE